MLLLIDSNKLSNHKITFDEPIEGKYKLISFQYTNNIYNVNENNNKIYMINDYTGATIDTLTEGHYNEVDFITHLSSQISGYFNSAPTLDDNTHKIYFDVGDDISWTFGTNTENSARKLIGMNEQDTYKQNSHYSDNPIDLNPIKSFFINITHNDDKNIQGTDYFNTSLIIPVTTGFGDNTCNTQEDFGCQYVKFHRTKTLQFKFHDINNNTVNLNSEWIMVLQPISNPITI